MSISPYIASLRKHVGHDLLMLPSVSGVVLDDGGEILLGRRSDNGRWALPAGAVDPGEQPADAVVREIAEETGVTAVVERLAGVALHPTTYPNGDECQYLNVWFRCRAVRGAARPVDGESLQVAWFGTDDLPDLHPFSLLRIDTALSNGAPAWFARPGERAQGAFASSDV